MFSADTQWEEWGRKDPYYAVLTCEDYRSGKLSKEARKQFFQSSEDHIDQVMHTIRNTLDDTFSPLRAVDFGCGVGRLVIPLAKICREVVAVDISPSMLDEAKRNVGVAQPTADVSFERSDHPWMETCKPFDLIHSFIVFQHIPAAKGMDILRRLLDKTAPGGCRPSFHLPQGLLPAAQDAEFSATSHSPTALPAQLTAGKIHFRSADAD